MTPASLLFLGPHEPAAPAADDAASLRGWLSAVRLKAPMRFMARTEPGTLLVGAARSVEAGRPPMALAAMLPWTLVSRHLAAVPLLCDAFLREATDVLERGPAAADAWRTVASPDLGSGPFADARHRLTEIQRDAGAGDFFVRTLGTTDAQAAAALMQRLQGLAEGEQATLIECPTRTLADALLFLDLLSRAAATADRLSGALWSSTDPLRVGLSRLPLPAPEPAQDLTQVEIATGGQPLLGRVQAALQRRASVRDLSQELFPGRR